MATFDTYLRTIITLLGGILVLTAFTAVTEVRRLVREWRRR